MSSAESAQVLKTVNAAAAWLAHCAQGAETRLQRVPDAAIGPAGRVLRDAGLIGVFTDPSLTLPPKAKTQRRPTRRATKTVPQTPLMAPVNQPKE